MVDTARSRNNIPRQFAKSIDNRDLLKTIGLVLLEEYNPIDVTDISIKQKREFYDFVQKGASESDPRYEPYFSHTATYMTNMIMLGNTIILLLITLIMNNKLPLPKHGMLGKLIGAKEHKELFDLKIDERLKRDILKFNESLNLVKHSVIGMSNERINDPQTAMFFDLKDRQAVTIPVGQQEDTIKLGQRVISKVKNLL